MIPSASRLPAATVRLRPAVRIRPFIAHTYPSRQVALVRYNSQLPPRLPPNPPHSDSGPSKPPPGEDRTYGEKLKQAAKTPTRWYPIPLALGALVILAIQFRKQLIGGPGSETFEVTSQGEQGAVLKSRNVDGPWQVRVLGALPLRSLSQLWGYLNGLVLPVWFRPYGFRLYSWIFGCDLTECVPQDLKAYESLGEFFYRELKPGARPIADAPMVSPADGRVLHFGEITGERVEQVKGLTYSLGALLGQEGEAVGEKAEIQRRGESGVQMVDDENFATINDIPYSIDKLMGSGKETKVEKETRRRWIYWGIGGEGWKFWKRRGDKAPQGEGEGGKWAFWRRKSGNKSSMAADESDASTTTEIQESGEEVDASHRSSASDIKHDTSVAISLGTSAMSSVTQRGQDLRLINPDNRLYFMVVYLAPGDYHRFHSPTNWVVERRRHFTGDLFSVSPYIANRLSNLFVLNERVALLGRWKHGFYSMVPVGATNVGSIRINFDENLRTNTRKLSHPAHTFTEAVYTSASTILQGQPLLSGEEMGGFMLGSTIVMVFEAPKNWTFTVHAGDKVKVGQELGRLKEEAKVDKSKVKKW